MQEDLLVSCFEGSFGESWPTAVDLFTTIVGDFSSFVLTVLQEKGQW